ncbi:hypothetical protein AMTRI_Chr06g175640 [Amborella trichopoda]
MILTLVLHHIFLSFWHSSISLGFHFHPKSSHGCVHVHVHIYGNIIQLVPLNFSSTYTPLLIINTQTLHHQKIQLCPNIWARELKGFKEGLMNPMIPNSQVLKC